MTAKKATRIPRDRGEPTALHLLLKQIELDARPGIVRVYILVDELGCECLAKGLLPGYVQEQARQAMDDCCIEARKPDHLRSNGDDPV